MLRRTVPLLLAVSLLAACATNPVTGKKEFNLVSEKDELQLGAQAHQQTLQEFHVYTEKPELNEMVTRIGRRIAAVSDRPNLPWTFTLLDTPMINAMALPGGYVYVTRGILERMNSEDEVAGVIAHEISHVAARHAARTISQQQLAQIGMVVGSVVAGPAATQAFGSLAQLGAELLFTRYSREQESQADLLGTAYMTEAGFNPHGAENMLRALQRLDTGKSSGVDRYFIDHPDPGKRVGDVRSEIARLEAKNASIGTTAMPRDALVRRLDGVITAGSTEETTIRGNTIYNRKYGIIVQAPPGWEATTSPGSLFVMAPIRNGNQQAVAQQVVAQEVPLQQLRGYNDVQTGIRTLVQNMGLQFVNSGVANDASGNRFQIDLWSGQTNSGPVTVETTQFVQGDTALVLMQIGSARNGQSDLVNTLRGMQIDRARARSADPARIHVARSEPGETWASVARRATGHPEDARQVANINGYDVNDPVPPSTLLKLPEDVIRSQS